MDTEILGRPSFAALGVQLEVRESVRAEPGAMMAQRNTRMDSGAAPGGIIGGIRRILAAKSFFLNTFTGTGANAEVCLTPCVPEDIEKRVLVPHSEIFMQGGALLACTADVDVDMKFQGLRGIFNREGTFFLRASAAGVAGAIFFHTYGALVELQLNQNVPLVLDNGHLVAFTQGVDYKIDKVRGLKTLLLGGEGIVLRFEGEGKVWAQTRELAGFAAALLPFLPRDDKA